MAYSAAEVAEGTVSGADSAEWGASTWGIMTCTDTASDDSYAHFVKDSTSDKIGNNILSLLARRGTKWTTTGLGAPTRVSMTQWEVADDVNTVLGNVSLELDAGGSSVEDLKNDSDFKDAIAESLTEGTGGWMDKDNVVIKDVVRLRS